MNVTLCHPVKMVELVWIDMLATLVIALTSGLAQTVQVITRFKEHDNRVFSLTEKNIGQISF